MSTREFQKTERKRRRRNAANLLPQPTRTKTRSVRRKVRGAVDTYLSGDCIRIDTYVKDPEWMHKLLKRDHIDT